MDIDDDEENPLLSSLVGLGGPAPKKPGLKRAPPGGSKPAGKTVNASAAGSIHPSPPAGAPNRPGSGRIMNQFSPTQSNLGASSHSATSDTMTSDTTNRSQYSVAASEASVDLMGAFTSLKKKERLEDSTTSSVHVIETMPHKELITFAKQLYAMVETYQLKMNEEFDLDEMLHLSNSMALNGSTSEHPGEGLTRSMVGGSMVFRRRGPMERPSSTGSAESSMSIMRPPVVEKGKLVKTKDDDGYKTINEYTIIAELGRGAYGKVKLAANEVTGESVAIKIMKKSLLKNGKNESVVMREIAIMKKLRHRNVVSLYEVINDPDAEKMYLVMQYIQNGPLYSLNKKDMTATPLPEMKVRKILRQLISGLRYLHKRNILHRDIKPDNILLGADDTPYLADFGVSEIAKTGSIHGMEGTPVFLAPELFRGDTHIDGCAVDVWALGVTIYGALYGKLPFIGRNYDQISRAVQQHPCHFPPENPVTPIWKDVLSRLLEKDARLRITLKELKTHPLFDSINGDGENVRNQESVKEVEVTDLEIMSSIRNVPHFSDKEVGHSKAFKLSAHAKMLIHRFVEKLRKNVEGRRLLKQGLGNGGTSSSPGGSGIRAIRGIQSPGGTSSARGNSTSASPATSKHNPLTARLPVTTNHTPASKGSQLSPSSHSKSALPSVGEGGSGRKASADGPRPAANAAVTPDNKLGGGGGGGLGDGSGAKLGKGLGQMPRLPSLRRTVRPVKK